MLKGFGYILGFIIAGLVFAVGCNSSQVSTARPIENKNIPAGAIAFTYASAFPSCVPVVDVCINGQGPYRFLLDTGSTSSSISTYLVEQLKISEYVDSNPKVAVTPDGYESASTKSVKVPASISGVALDDLVLQVRDDYNPGGGFAGIIGFDVLKNKMARFNFSEKYLELLPRTAGKLPGEIPADFDRGVAIIPIVIGKGSPKQLTLRVVIDSGCSMGLVLPKDVKDKLSLSQPLQFGGIPKAKLADRDSKIAGVYILTESVAIDGLDTPRPGFGMVSFKTSPGGLLGMGSLRDCVVTFDAAGKRVAIVPQAGVTQRQLRK